MNFCISLQINSMYFYEDKSHKRSFGWEGISQTWLAKKQNKSFNTVNSYVYNRSQPTLETLLTIANILYVDVRLLIENNEDEQLDK